MVGKLIVWALDWEGAVKKASRALDEFYIDGVITNLPLHREIVKDKDFIEGKLNTSYLDKKMELFNLKATKTIADEEQKTSFIASLIKKIKEHKLIVRH
jgi:pyruvate carboxylase subunit A